MFGLFYSAGRHNIIAFPSCCLVIRYPENGSFENFFFIILLNRKFLNLVLTYSF